MLDIISKGFLRSWPLGPARGVRSAGVEGQNLSMLGRFAAGSEGRRARGRRCDRKTIEDARTR